MALQEIYKRFLASPAADFLAADVSLNYVPTTTALEKPTTVLKHLNAQKQLVEKKDEKFLNVIEGLNSICVETETTLEFTHGGGTYLPGLDDNFITGRTVTLPITHIVIFNDEQRIKQIRLLWDQACLLKAVDTIGARGRNWPIRDAADQLKMIVSSAAAAPTPAPDERAGRPKTRGVDPHSSLSLFENRTAHDREESQPNLVAPRESARPTQRDFGEIFAGQEPIGSPERSVSPNKRDRENSNPLKGGAGQNFRESRLFNHEDASAALKNPSIKTQPTKFDHFEFGEPEFKVPQTPSANKFKKTNQASWDFESFHTPDKPPTRNLTHHKPNFDWQTDATVPDAKPPFADPSTASPQSDERPKTSSSTRSGLYEDNVHGGDDGTYGGRVSAGEKMPLKNITNPNAHNKTFGSHFATNNSVPDQSSNDNNENSKQGTKNKSARSGENGWDFLSGEPPVSTGAKSRGINIAGDGMGNRKTSEKNWWEEGY